MQNTIIQQQAAIIRNQARILDLLHWNLAMYCAFMHNCGLKYLELYIGKDEQLAAQLDKQQVFWNWWKNLFNARNEAFIEEWDGMEDTISVDDLRTIYRDIHNPALLACEIKPPRIVYGHSLIKMEMPV